MTESERRKWAEERAREIVSQEIGFTTGCVILGREHLRSNISHALLEARRIGRREGLEDALARVEKYYAPSFHLAKEIRALGAKEKTE